ncbi:hypothetical protein Ancab_022559 [Ancistrocladus abbreviatus]
MNQPILYHQPTSHLNNGTMRGNFRGTNYVLGSDICSGVDNLSYYEVVWEKEVGAAVQLPESPDFKFRLRLDVKQGGGRKSQFHLIDIGSCCKNNGDPCDGDVLTDVTRYSEMIVNPATPAWCSPSNLRACPPYHITPNDTKIYRNDTANFPCGAYHYYCGPGNFEYVKKFNDPCDPYSNPHAQEIVQLLPHPIWAEYGYPTKPGQGWDPGSPPAKRTWTSMDVGTEIFVSDGDEVAEWILSDFDVIITS